MGKAKVLVVDDDPMIRRVVEKVLLDCDVDLAPDGQAALEKVSVRFRDRIPAYDLILSDLDMPKKGGADFMREAVAGGYAPRSSFVFMSAMVTGDAALSLVRDDFLVLRKPFTMASLLAAVRDRLTGRGGMDKIGA